MDKYLIRTVKEQPNREEKEITDPNPHLKSNDLELLEIKEVKEKKKEKEKYVLCTPSEEQSEIIKSVID